LLTPTKWSETSSLNLEIILFYKPPKKKIKEAQHSLLIV